MAKFIDFILCTLSTLCMFAVPVVLLGLAPWMAEHLLHFAHISSYTGFVAALEVIGLMLASSAGVILLVLPLFAGTLYLLMVWVRKNDAAGERQEARASARHLGDVEQAIGRFNAPISGRTVPVSGRRATMQPEAGTASPLGAGGRAGSGVSERIKTEKSGREKTAAERLAAARLSKLAGR